MAFSKDEVQDQSEESRPQSDPCNFTSPLPFHASPDRQAAVQEASEKEPSLNGGEEAFSQEGEGPANETKGGAELNEEDVLEEKQSGISEKEDREKEGFSNPSTSDLDPASSTEKTTSRQSASPAEDQTPSPKLEVVNHTDQPKASYVTKHDKRIIEKIRSYYEAAAKAEEDGAEGEGELEDGGESRRRNSFSHIPCGRVKESVLLLDEFGHLGEPQSRQIQSEFSEASDRNEDPPYQTNCPVRGPSEVLAGAEDTIKDSQSSDGETQLLDASKLKDCSGQVALVQNSLTNVEDEMKESDREVKRGSAEGLLEVSQEEQNGPAAPGQEDWPNIAKELNSRKEIGVSRNRGQISSNELECKQSSSTEPHRSTKELPVAHEVECSKSGTKCQSSWVRKKPRDLTKVSRNVDGQWSYHSRIVTSNRALFESMRSDVTSIGLFEATPEVDPVLIENSERILSKVQTLAQMFGAKAGSMKVPLHQKRGATTQSPPWAMARWSGNSPHGHHQNTTHVQTQSQQHNGKIPKESNHDHEAKIVNQNNVDSQSQGKTQEEGKVQERKTFLQSSSKFLKSWGYILRIIVKITPIFYPGALMFCGDVQMSQGIHSSIDLWSCCQLIC